MRACGVGLRDLLRPIVVLGLGCVALTLRWRSRSSPPRAARCARSLTSLIARGAGARAGPVPALRRRAGSTSTGASGESPARHRGLRPHDPRAAVHRVRASRGQHRGRRPSGELALVLERGDIHLDAAQRARRPLPAHRLRALRVRARRRESARHPTRASAPKEMSIASCATPSSGSRRASAAGPARPPIEYEIDLQRRFAAPARAGAVRAGRPADRHAPHARRARLGRALVRRSGVRLLRRCSRSPSFLAEQGWHRRGRRAWLPNAGFAALGAALLRARAASAPR